MTGAETILLRIRLAGSASNPNPRDTHHRERTGIDRRRRHRGRHRRRGGRRPGQADDADDWSDAGGSDDDRTGNVRADRLSVDINTGQDFTLSITTYESDLTRSSTAGQRSQPVFAPAASGAVGAVAAFTPRAEPSAPIAQIDASETVRAAAESFEADTATVSAGYVDVEHALGDGAIAGATFAFSIRRAYLEELGVAPEGVTLYHRLDGEWETRKTER